MRSKRKYVELAGQLPTTVKNSSDERVADFFELLSQSEISAELMRQKAKAMEIEKEMLIMRKAREIFTTAGVHEGEGDV